MKNIINKQFILSQILKDNKIDVSWKNFIGQEIKKDYFINLEKKVNKAYKNNIIYPQFKNIFKYLELNINDIKVVCIGQDPYHKANQATGLAFSVNDNIATPPSLRNIFKELENDLNIVKTNNSLDLWFRQGFFAINWFLTVEESKPLSHKDFGWEIWTNNLIKYIEANHKNKFIYLLWGSFAQKIINNIHINDERIIKSSHPSPLSSYRSFFGSKPFSKINNFLKCSKIKLINFDC